MAVSDSGQHAVYGSGAVLMVADVSDPAAPANVGEIYLPDLPRAVAAFGDRVYLADGDAGLVVFDVSSCSALFSDGFESGDTSAWSLTVP